MNKNNIYFLIAETKSALIKYTIENTNTNSKTYKIITDNLTSAEKQLKNL